MLKKCLDTKRKIKYFEIILGINLIAIFLLSFLLYLEI